MGREGVDLGRAGKSECDQSINKILNDLMKTSHHHHHNRDNEKSHSQEANIVLMAY